MRRSSVLTTIFAILAVAIGALVAILLNDGNGPDDAGGSEIPATYRDTVD